MTARERYRNQDGAEAIWTPHVPSNVEDCEWRMVSGGQNVHCGEPATWTEEAIGLAEHTQEWCDAHKREWTADHDRLPLQ